MMYMHWIKYGAVFLNITPMLTLLLELHENAIFLVLFVYIESLWLKSETNK